MIDIERKYIELYVMGGLVHPQLGVSLHLGWIFGHIEITVWKWRARFSWDRTWA